MGIINYIIYHIDGELKEKVIYINDIKVENLNLN